MAQSRHPDRVDECPLLGVKRTSKSKSVTSAFTAGGRNLQSTGTGARLRAAPLAAARHEAECEFRALTILDLSGKQSGDPVARTRCRAKSAEITHAAIWPSDLHAPHTALSHDR